MREAFEDWAAGHPWTATVLGVLMFAGITAVGLLMSGQDTGFALAAAAAVGGVTLGMFALASRLSGRPVMFGLFGGGQTSDGSLGPYHAPEGWWGGDGGGGGA